MPEMKNTDLKGSNPTKIKLLKLLELLRCETDEGHPLTTAELLTKLEAEGIPCDRRTLSKDISVLNSHDYEIMSVMIGHDKAYYVEDRSFSLPELKILIDAVQAAAFITDRKTDELIEKSLSWAEATGQIFSRRIWSALTPGNTVMNRSITMSGTLKRPCSSTGKSPSCTTIWMRTEKNSSAATRSAMLLIPPLSSTTRTIII